MSKNRILLVDDEPSIRLLLSTILESSGYIVDVAEDGFAALKQIQQTVPDLVITDLRMPNMNGFELLSVIRHRFPDLPTIAISGEFLACHIDEGPLADAFFQKGSYSIPEFLARIEALVGGGSARPTRKSRTTAVWQPTGSGPVMLTCTECLRSFPIDPSGGRSPYPAEVDCIFCGARLHVQLVAVGISSDN